MPTKKELQQQASEMRKAASACGVSPKTSSFMLIQSARMYLDNLEGQADCDDKEASETLKKCAEYLTEASNLLHQGNETKDEDESVEVTTPVASDNDDDDWTSSSSTTTKSESEETETESKSESETSEFESISVLKRNGPHLESLDWDDVVGHKEAKEALKAMMVWPKLYPQLFDPTCPRKPWRGILLYGPQGIGKCMLSKIAASKAGAAFVYINPRELVDKFPGAEAKNEFEKLVQNQEDDDKMKVIFIDEIEAWFGDKIERLLDMRNYLRVRLAELIYTGRVIVVGAKHTIGNRSNATAGLGNIFRQRIGLKLPDIFEMCKIFEKELAVYNCEPKVNILKQSLENEGARFSGADIRNICRQTALISAHDMIKEFEQRGSNGKHPVDKGPLLTGVAFRKAMASYSCKLSCFLKVTVVTDEGAAASKSEAPVIKGSHVFPFFKIV